MNAPAGKMFRRSLLRGAAKADYPLIWLGLCLVAFGIVMVYSATVSGRELAGITAADGSVVAYPKYFLIRQSVFALVFLAAAAFLVWRVPMSFWQKHARTLLFLNLALLVLVLLVGKEINGAKRWLDLGLFSLQPAELFKITVILYLADYIVRNEKFLTDVRQINFAIIFPAVGCILIYLSTDLGSLIIIAILTFTVLWFGRTRILWFFFAISTFIALVSAAILTSPHRIKRMETFLNPADADPLREGYQINQALNAVANGGFFGQGLGESWARYSLSEIHTDFIAALIIEELGMAGALVLLLCYIWLALRAFSIADKARRLDIFFSSYAATGIGTWLLLQALFHLGINIAAFPTKGLTLPFISYGGSSLLVSITAVALLVRIDYENRRKMRSFEI